MTERLSGKRVLLTGGIANIGRAILESFVAEGATVTVVDINEEGGKALKDEFKGKVNFVRADLQVESEIADAVKQAASLMGGLDTMCLNAGIQISGKVDTFKTSDWDKVFSINVRANFLFIREALDELRRAGKSSIIINSSLAGKRGGPNLSAYSASKAAVLGITSSLAIELASDGIRVNAVCPGWIDTPFNQPIINLMGGLEEQAIVVKRVVPLGRQATPDEVAPLFVYLASDESSYVTAQAINVDGGAYN